MALFPRASSPLHNFLKQLPGLPIALFYSPQFATTRNGPFLLPCCQLPVMKRL